MSRVQFQPTQQYLATLWAPILLVVATALPVTAEPPGKTGQQPSAEAASPARVHRITFFDGDRQSEPQTIDGRILVEASNGILLQADDGALYTIFSENVTRHVRTDEVFAPATHEEIAQRLMEKFPGFRIHTTDHYVVCYGTSRVYARWTSSLLERLHRAFTRYWSHEGFDLHEPEFPLTALVFPDAGSYKRAAIDQVGQINSGVVGYYSMQSNRVNMYDLTGVEALRAPGHHRGSLKQVNAMLSQPGAVPLVATIVHEATHQIAFNCGLQTRYSDIPLWLLEGMAEYFEAPDLTSARGWQGIGKVNYARLATFRRNRPRWNRSTIMSLLAENDRLRNPRTAAAAYANAWALNYYLIEYRPKEYAAYLKMLAEKPPLKEDDPDTRLAEFREHFGDIRELERDFLKQMERVR